MAYWYEGYKGDKPPASVCPVCPLSGATGRREQKEKKRMFLCPPLHPLSSLLPPTGKKRVAERRLGIKSAGLIRTRAPISREMPPPGRRQGGEERRGTAGSFGRSFLVFFWEEMGEEKSTDREF